ncbi:MAG: NAD(P)/FAD-dependent oxidoreductase, partial [Steroidobacteraceae bacterium]
CRRRVVVCDAGKPRNAAARALHGYLTRDGIVPSELLRLGREELEPYGIHLRHVSVSAVTCTGNTFDVRLETGEQLVTRTVLLATGVRDDLPAIEGLEACYGISVHHCPYCDGWESRERALAVIGQGASGAALALSLKTWSDRVTLCSNGRARLSTVQRARLDAQQIAVVEAPIARLDHVDGRGRALVPFSGEPVACAAVFFSAGQSPQSDLPRRLGCEFTRRGTVKTDHLGQTRVPGLYVVGDASRDVQFVIVAAAEGAKAAVAINKALQARAGLSAVAATS